MCFQKKLNQNNGGAGGGGGWLFPGSNGQKKGRTCISHISCP